MNSNIPIFPLNIVMFPGAIYPLHIFEERYKRLIQYCRTSQEGFGIISKIDERISDVGCYVKLLEIINVYDNGSMDILVKGISRFRKLNHTMHRDGYLLSDIQEYSDKPDSLTDKQKANEVITQFKRIIEKTDLTLSEHYWAKLESSEYIAFKIAEKSGLNVKQQQDILTSRDENERLESLLKHFSFVETYMEKNSLVKDIIMRDGYIE